MSDKKKSRDESPFSARRLLPYMVFTAVFIAVSFLSLLFIYHLLSDKTSFVTIEAFSHAALLKLFALMAVYFMLDGLRLFYILKALEIHIEFRYLMKLVFVNMFISGVTPLATGGGFVQVYFLSKKGVSVGDAVAATSIRTALPILFFLTATPIILIADKKYLNLLSNGSSSGVILTGVLLYLSACYGIYRILRDTRIPKGIVMRFTEMLCSRRIISNERAKSITSISFLDFPFKYSCTI